MWVKICANTNLEDAKLAADLGADALGFVFAPSSRQVTAEQVAAIVPHLPGSVETIGVFATRDVEEIVGIVRATGLTGVQLHGGFDVDLARRLDRAFEGGVTIVQTLHWAVDSVDSSAAAGIAAQLKEIAAEPAIHRVLVDSKAGHVSGGTGLSFGWGEAQATLAPAMRAGAAERLIVAGGLHPDNVAQAIAALDPWGVDVASGVEAVRGKKDRLKLQRFLESARAARETLI